MTRTVLVDHDDGDRHITIQQPRRGSSSFQLIFNTKGGLETVIPFDELALERNTVELYRRIGRVRYEAGSVERDLDAWGDVGEWLRQHATPVQGAIA